MQQPALHDEEQAKCRVRSPGMRTGFCFLRYTTFLEGEMLLFTLIGSGMLSDTALFSPPSNLLLFFRDLPACRLLDERSLGPGWDHKARKAWSEGWGLTATSQSRCKP